MKLIDIYNNWKDQQVKKNLKFSSQSLSSLGASEAAEVLSQLIETAPLFYEDNKDNFLFQVQQISELEPRKALNIWLSHINSEFIEPVNEEFWWSSTVLLENLMMYSLESDFRQDDIFQMAYPTEKVGLMIGDLQNLIWFRDIATKFGLEKLTSKAIEMKKELIDHIAGNLRLSKEEKLYEVSYGTSIGLVAILQSNNFHDFIIDPCVSSSKSCVDIHRWPVKLTFEINYDSSVLGIVDLTGNGSSSFRYNNAFSNIQTKVNPDDSYQRKGIGTFLVQFALNYYKKTLGQREYRIIGKLEINHTLNEIEKDADTFQRICFWEKQGFNVDSNKERITGVLNSSNQTLTNNTDLKIFGQKVCSINELK